MVGRNRYISEGCYHCRSQQIRPMVAETKRYGEYSKPGEFSLPQATGFTGGQ
ncbi:MAG: cbb3-type cytochrome c oxidase subunit II [Planctomycetales bacterium]|nr:cbb3-type cytochrome c oxidase subunit II [Planctomycetales bacterium]